MTLKELSQLYHLKREIKMYEKKLKELRASISAPAGTNLTGMPRSNSYENRLERNVAEIADLEAIIYAKKTECLHELKRLERYIFDIPDSLTRRIFTLRFIECLSWPEVAENIKNNSEDSVKKICYRYIKKTKNDGI